MISAKLENKIWRRFLTKHLVWFNQRLEFGFYSTEKPFKRVLLK